VTTNTKTVRDHYQAGIEGETELLAKLNCIIDEMKPPVTAEKFADFDQFHVGGLAATVELAKRTAISRAYTKLGISSRDQLAQIIDGEKTRVRNKKN
jgi:hypothetical protein